MATISKDFAAVVLDNNNLRVDGTSLDEHSKPNVDDPASGIYVVLSWDGTRKSVVGSCPIPAGDAWHVEFAHDGALKALGEGDEVHLIGLAIYPDELHEPPFVWEKTLQISTK